MATPKQRRAVYKFYRDLGYTPAQASKMRNRTKAVIKDWAEEKRRRRREMIDQGRSRPRPIKAPTDVLDREDILKFRHDLVKMGLSKKAAYNMTRSKKKSLQNHYNIERTLEALGKPTRKAAVREYKKMMNRWQAAQKEADIYAAIETAYNWIVGVKPVIKWQCPKCGWTGTLDNLKIRHTKKGSYITCPQCKKSSLFDA